MNKRQKVMWAANGLMWIVGCLLTSIGMHTTYHHFFGPKTVTQLPWLAMGNSRNEYCPIPIVDVEGRVNPFHCHMETLSPHLVCDCSAIPPKERKVFTDLLAYLDKHPLPNKTLVKPILPGDATGQASQSR